MFSHTRIGDPLALTEMATPTNGIGVCLCLSGPTSRCFP